jgi:hypothetical protein
MPSPFTLRSLPPLLSALALLASPAWAQDVTASETLNMGVDEINKISIAGSVSTMTWDNDAFDVGATSAVQVDDSTTMDYTLGQGVAMTVHFDDSNVDPTARATDGTGAYKYAAIKSAQVQIGSNPETTIFSSNGSNVVPTVSMDESPATVIPANADGGQGSGETPATVTYTVEVDLTMGGAFDATTFDLVYTAVDPTP